MSYAAFPLYSVRSSWLALGGAGRDLAMRGTEELATELAAQVRVDTFVARGLSGLTDLFLCVQSERIEGIEAYLQRLALLGAGRQLETRELWLGCAGSGEDETGPGAIAEARAAGSGSVEGEFAAGAGGVAGMFAAGSGGVEGELAAGSGGVPGKLAAGSAPVAGEFAAVYAVSGADPTVAVATALGTDVTLAVWRCDGLAPAEHLVLAGAADPSELCAFHRRWQREDRSVSARPLALGRRRAFPEALAGLAPRLD